MILKDQTIYDGSLIHNRFAYQYFKERTAATGNIVAFVAPAKVDTGLIDLEDALQKDYIFSEKMIHFCWEIPIARDSFGAVAFQRLLNIGIADIIGKKIKQTVMIDGDDIMVRDSSSGDPAESKKASVSITYHNGEAVLGHTGINIVAGSEAPSFAYSTNLSDEDADDVIRRVMDYFYWLTNDMFNATTKIRVPK